MDRVTYEGFAVDRDILVNGSIQLVQALVEQHLVGELRLMVFPVVLGGGKQLFGQTNDAATFKLLEARPAGDTLITIYLAASKPDDA